MVRINLDLDLPALDKLFGGDGDTEVVVELRRAVAEEFAKKNLKAFVNDATFAQIHTKWEQVWQDEIKTQIQSFVASKAAAPTPGMRRDVHEAFARAIVPVVDAYINDQLKARLSAFETEIRRTTRKVFAEVLAAEVMEEVRVAVDAAVRDLPAGRIEAAVAAEVQRRLDAAAAMRPDKSPK